MTTWGEGRDGSIALAPTPGLNTAAACAMGRTPLAASGAPAWEGSATPAGAARAVNARGRAESSSFLVTLPDGTIRIYESTALTVQAVLAEYPHHDLSLSPSHALRLPPDTLLLSWNTYYLHRRPGTRTLTLDFSPKPGLLHEDFASPSQEAHEQPPCACPPGLSCACASHAPRPDQRQGPPPTRQRGISCQLYLPESVSGFGEGLGGTAIGTATGTVGMCRSRSTGTPGAVWAPYPPGAHPHGGGVMPPPMAPGGIPLPPHPFHPMLAQRHNSVALPYLNQGLPPELQLPPRMMGSLQQNQGLHVATSAAGAGSACLPRRRQMAGGHEQMLGGDVLGALGRSGSDQGWLTSFQEMRTPEEEAAATPLRKSRSFVPERMVPSSTSQKGSPPGAADGSGYQQQQQQQPEQQGQGRRNPIMEELMAYNVEPPSQPLSGQAEGLPLGRPVHSCAQDTLLLHHHAMAAAGPTHHSECFQLQPITDDLALLSVQQSSEDLYPECVEKTAPNRLRRVTTFTRAEGGQGVHSQGWRQSRRMQLLQELEMLEAESDAEAQAQPLGLHHGVVGFTGHGEGDVVGPTPCHTVGAVSAAGGARRQQRRQQMHQLLASRQQQLREKEDQQHNQAELGSPDEPPESGAKRRGFLSRLPLGLSRSKSKKEACVQPKENREGWGGPSVGQSRAGQGRAGCSPGSRNHGDWNAMPLAYSCSAARPAARHLAGEF